MSYERRIDVWKKGRIVDGYDKDEVRKDSCGAWIKFNKYADRTHENGWEIDHRIPESKGGSDSIDNLFPLQWKNNASKQDGKPECPVTSKDE